MDGSHTSIESLLVDYELGLLDEQERGVVERALKGSSDLQEREDRLRETFDVLERWSVPAAPPYLVSRVMARVAEAAPSPNGGPPLSSLPPRYSRVLGAGPILTARELVAIAACITLFVGIFVPAAIKARNIAWRAACSQQLETIAAGLASYAQDFGGQLPSAGFARGAYWAPGPRGVRRTSNTRHAWLVVKHGHLSDPALFVCPARREGRPMVADDYSQFDDVAEKANFTYAYQNMGSGVGPAWKQQPQMAIMADANPLLGGPAPHQLSPYSTDLNSPNHEQEDGQNVLFCDGSIRWTRSPNVGVARDNIWTPAGHRGRTLLARWAVPASATDSFLINCE